MRIDIQHTAKDEHVMLYVNGRLAAELALDTVATRDDLAAEVYRARGYQHLVRQVRGLAGELERVGEIADHVEVAPASRKVAWCEGLQDGLAGKEETHPLDPQGLTLPKGPRKATNSYVAGYRFGEAIRLTVEAIERGPKT